MESGKKLEDKFMKELEKEMHIEKLKDFPMNINIQQDNIPDIERWRTHERVHCF